MGSVSTQKSAKRSRNARKREDARAKRLSSKVTVRFEDPTVIAERIASSPDRTTATWLGQHKGIARQ